MNATRSAAFLRVPPFPGARPQDLTVGGVDQNSDLDSVIAALRRHRVGGDYWADTPELPEHYLLVRSCREKLAAELNGQEPVVRWTHQATKHGAGHLEVRGPCDPWHLVAGASEVVVDADDEVALVAALAGVPVRCLGEGRFADLAAGGDKALRAAVGSEVLQRGFRNPFTGEGMPAEEAIALCGFWRRLIDGNRTIAAVFGCASWKRATVAPLLWSGSGTTAFDTRLEAIEPGAEVAIWRSRTPKAALQRIEAGAWRQLEIEDGFIRSSGLGADCIPPLSIVLDRSGIYFDPAASSDLETILQSGTFDAALVERAKLLRHVIVASGVTKYATGTAATARRGGDRRHLLVTGQVEDDRAVLSGLGPATNLGLLRRVREDAADAYIIYKPHPDVEAGHRKGRIDDRTCLELADEIVRDVPITALIAAVDEVHVNTSLAGFEALLREKPVVTYGVPFYAGWGLTVDKGPVPDRRSARSTLDELVAAALLVYPRYLDPLTGLPCPPEVLISRLREAAPESPGLLVRLRRLQGALRRWLPTRLG